ILGADQKEYGPVTAEQIRQWITEGRANNQTLAQAAGNTDWKPLSSFPEFAATFSAPPPPVQADPRALAETVLARDVRISVGECLRRGWNLMSSNLGLFLGTSAVLLVLQLALGFVPIIGALAYFIIFGALYGGFYMVFLKRLRGESASVGDLFSGFGQDFVQFMLAGIVTYLLTTVGTFLCILPGIYLAVAWKFSFVLVADRRLDFWHAMELSRKVVTRHWLELFGIIFVAYLPLVLFMAYSVVHVMSVVFPMIANSGGRLDFVQITRIIKGFVALPLIQQLILLFTLPFATSALIHAYEDLFGTRPAPAA